MPYYKMKTAKLRALRQLFYFMQAAVRSCILKKETVHAYPLSISVEAASSCNLKCRYCYQASAKDKFDRGGGNMDFGLFEELIKEISGKPYPVNINFDLGGEPFLNDRLMDMVELASAHKRFTNISTNGTMLTDEIIDRILDSGLNKIGFSIDFLRGENMRDGSDIREVVSNIDKMIYRRNMSKKSKPRIIIRSLDLKGVLVKSLIGLFENRPDAVFFNPPTNWAGLIDFPRLGEAYNICMLPWLEMAMLHNGECILCCNDMQGAFMAGKFPDQNLQDIWQGNKLKTARRAIMDKDSSFSEGQNCPRCTRLKNPIPFKNYLRYLYEEARSSFA